MSHKTTRKALKNEYTAIIAVKPADVENLLSSKEPFAYTEGVHGKCFIYRDSPNNKVVFCVGEHPFGNYAPSEERTRFYDAQAEKHVNAKCHPRYWGEHVRCVEKIRWEFVFEALMGYAFGSR